MIHIILGIVTVNIESVTQESHVLAFTRGVECAIYQGTACNEFGLDQFAPFLLGIINGTVIIIPLHLDVDTLVITEGADGLHNLGVFGTTHICAIVHRLGLTHIAKEVGDRVLVHFRYAVNSRL